MATEATKAPATSNGAAKSVAKKLAEKKPIRTEAQLKAMGLVGNLIIVAKKVQSVCTDNNYVGTELEGMKYASSAMYRAQKNIETVDQKSEAFKAFHASCKAAVPDLKAYENGQKFTKAIKDVVVTLLELQPERAPKGLNMSVLDDIKL